jgi:hypothetical protein
MTRLIVRCACVTARASRLRGRATPFRLTTLARAALFIMS